MVLVDNYGAILDPDDPPKFLVDELVGKSRSMEIYGSSDTKSLRFQEHFQVKTPKQFDIHQPPKNGAKKQVTHCKFPPKRQPKKKRGHGKKTSAESRKNRCQNMESLMSLKRSSPWSLGSMGRKQWENDGLKVFGKDSVTSSSSSS